MSHYEHLIFLFILSDVSLRESQALYNSFKLPVVSCRGDNMYMCSILSCNFSRPVSLSYRFRSVFLPPTSSVHLCQLCRLHCCLMVSYALSGLIYMHARVIHLMENCNKKKINLYVLSTPFLVFFFYCNKRTRLYKKIG